jgi:hypothetical protein
MFRQWGISWMPLVVEHGKGQGLSVAEVVQFASKYKIVVV